MLIIFIIAISLSMDAFSLALAYGTQNLEKKQIIKLSLIVGIYHFFMPQIGNIIGKKVFELLPINQNLIIFSILFIIGIQMIIETFKTKKTLKIMKNIEMMIFGLLVSIDSFSVGIGIKSIYNNTILSSFIFSITSLIFTNVGLYIGKSISKIIGNLATLFGGITLIIIGFIYLV